MISASLAKLVSPISDFNQEIRDAVLGHAKPGLQKTYNKHGYFEEKKAALDAYAKHIMEVMK